MDDGMKRAFKAARATGRPTKKQMMDAAEKLRTDRRTDAERALDEAAGKLAEDLVAKAEGRA